MNEETETAEQEQQTGEQTQNTPPPSPDADVSEDATDANKVDVDSIEFNKDVEREVMPTQAPSEGYLPDDQKETNKDNSDTSTDETETQSDQQTKETSTDKESTESPDSTTDTVPEPDKGDDTQVDSEDYATEYQALSEETGVQVSSDDDVVAALKELGSLRSQGASSLSPAITAAIAVEKQGGDLVSHFQRVGMDFDGMDAKEVLRQRFFKDQAVLHKSNPRLAQMKFEREYVEKYGVWERFEKMSKEEQNEWLEEGEHSKEDVEYAKLTLETDVSQGRVDLNAWKKESAPQPVTPESKLGLSPEEAKTLEINYNKQVADALGNFEATSIPMGSDKDDYVLGLTDTTRPIVEGWAKTPASFLDAIGFQEKSIDIERLLPIMTLIAEAANGTLGGRISKFSVDGSDVDTLQNNIGKPAPNVPAIPGGDSGDDIWDQVGQAAVEAQSKLDRRARGLD